MINFSRRRCFVLIVLVLGTISCGARQRDGSKCMRGVSEIRDSSRHGEKEWNWFLFREPGNKVFRQNGLKIMAAEPLWERPTTANTLDHLRIIWNGPASGIAVVEVQWDDQFADVELFALYGFVSKRYPIREHQELRAVIESCATRLSSGCFGSTLEHPFPNLSFDVDQLTMEYRKGDVVYAIARQGVDVDMQRRGLEAFVNCACNTIKLLQERVSWGIELTCRDVAR